MEYRSYSILKVLPEPHTVDAERLHTFVFSVNMPQEPGAIDHIVMNTNSGSSEEVKQEYVSPIMMVVTIKTEQAILSFSNEHTEEEELF